MQANLETNNEKSFLLKSHTILLIQSILTLQLCKSCLGGTVASKTTVCIRNKLFLEIAFLKEKSCIYRNFFGIIYTYRQQKSAVLFRFSGLRILNDTMLCSNDGSISA